VSADVLSSIFRVEEVTGEMKVKLMEMLKKLEEIK